MQYMYLHDVTIYYVLTFQYLYTLLLLVTCIPNRLLQTGSDEFPCLEHLLKLQVSLESVLIVMQKKIMASVNSFSLCWGWSNIQEDEYM